MIYSFSNIIPDKYYNIQAIICNDPIIFKYGINGCLYSVILKDYQNHEIELIAWGESCVFLRKQDIKKGQMYCFKNIESVANMKYIKTKHKTKLIYKKNQSSIKTIKHLDYKLNDQICVYTKNILKKKSKKKQNEQDEMKQLSIRNWLK